MHGWNDTLGLDETEDAVLLDQVRRAIAIEHAATHRSVPLRLEDATLIDKERGIWELQVESDAPFEEGGSWTGARIGRNLDPESELTPWSGEVVETDPDADVVFVAVGPDGDAPTPGPCRIWPYDFLEALHRLLANPGFHHLRGRLSGRLRAAHDAPPGRRLEPVVGVLGALGHCWSIVWGPPGTGKTHTLVHQAMALLDHPDERVLILSNTNRAVDEIALRLGTLRRERGRSLQGLTRLGMPASLVAYREQQLTELLPTLDVATSQQLEIARSQAKNASTRGQRAMAHHEAMEIVRSVPTLGKRPLDPRDRCVITTLHAALKAIVGEDLRDLGREGRAPFTTLILDEASLVSRAHTAAASLLSARRVVLVGDPCQLSPIARAARSMPPPVEAWLARSGLDGLQLGPHIHRLTTQYRMHPQIRRAVSALSYDDALLDAAEVVDRDWQTTATLRRRPRALWYVLDEHEPHRPAEVRSTRGPEGTSRVRPLAQRVLAALFAVHPELGGSQGLFVTPYRAQADAIGAWLRGHHPTWRASTVHAQQGSEAEVVVFDPVHASSTSWPRSEWRRLVNVGLSRARQMLIWLASRAETEQPWLQPIRPHLTAFVLRPHSEGWTWETLEQLPSDEPDLFAPAPAPKPTEPRLSDAPTRGAQIRRRATLHSQLSHEQERLVHRDLRDGGPRLVRGVAGSGKTLVLAHWAVRALVGLGIPEVTIVYCNRALRPLIERMIVGAWGEHPARPVPWDAIRLVHVADLLRGLHDELDLPSPSSRDYDYESQAARLLQAGPPEPRFHALFLDEAQDLGHDTLRLLIHLTRPRDAQRPVMIFYDNAQNVYGRGTPRWSELGLDLRGRSDVMRECFRATRPIIELALNLLHQLRPLTSDPDLQELMRPAGRHPALLRPIETEQGPWWRADFCGIDGEPAIVHRFDRRDDELDWVVSKILALLETDDLEPRNLRVVTTSKRLRQQLTRRLNEALPSPIQAKHLTYEGFDEWAGAIVITTPHSFKGHDAEVVFVPFVDTFLDTHRKPWVSPLYVALTRARTLLVTTGSRDESPEGDRIMAALDRVVATRSEATRSH